ncbi:Hypothetical predicted protein [Olea europaea subsp. europaea]|uniref:Uncharacterized protein n=1 Tax=Olea europaea subsp. europaea TaxID=158383 RepID=A0A8S0V6Z7_OLEEU|nr:Hypothetical predicted protein [Olea europaea subsp. europaea]
MIKFMLSSCYPFHSEISSINADENAFINARFVKNGANAPSLTAMTMLYRIPATLELDAIDKSLVYIQVFVGEFALTILFSVASKNCVISSSLLSFVLGFVEVV